MKLSAIIEPLLRARVDPDVILDAVRAFEAEQDAKADAGKEKARARWRKWKAEQTPTNVGKRLQALANDSCEGVTRVEDISSTNKITGKKEGKKETSPSAQSNRGTRIPDDFVPDIEAAISEGLTRQEAERQARSFCDWWRAKPGKDGLKLDWPATWRVWYRRNLSAPPQRNATSPPQNSINDAIDRVIRGSSDAPFASPTIDASYERTDRRGAQNLVQFDAAAARFRS